MVRYIVILLIVAITSCTKEKDNILLKTTLEEDKWLVDTNNMTGTKISYRFPVVTDPIYSSINNSNNINPYDLVIAFKIDNTILIYPLTLMGVEVVNGTINNTHFAATYCPKTRTTYVINREINNKIHTFSASGLLYNDNLVYYDVETESIWSQIFLKCIHGEYYHNSPEIIHSFQTTFNIAKESFPDAKLLSNYTSVHINQKSLAKNINYKTGHLIYGINSYSKPDAIDVLDYDLLDGEGLIENEDLLIIYNTEYKFITSFIKPQGYTFAYTGNYPDILVDNFGNYWNVFGEKTIDNNDGIKLKTTSSYLALWWAWDGIFETFTFIDE